MIIICPLSDHILVSHHSHPPCQTLTFNLTLTPPRFPLTYVSYDPERESTLKYDSTESHTENLVYVIGDYRYR